MTDHIATHLDVRRPAVELRIGSVVFRAGAAVACLFATLPLGCIVLLAMKSQPGVQEEIVTKSLRIVDEKGNSAIRMSAVGNSEVVFFDDENPGMPRMVLGTGAFGTPSIQLLSRRQGADGTTVGSRLTLTNEGEPGTPRITFQTKGKMELTMGPGGEPIVTGESAASEKRTVTWTK